jgi:hypothetical protein
MTVKQRVLAYNWNKEGLIVLSILGYIILHYFGIRLNQKKVEGWIKSHRQVLSSQFYQVGPDASVQGAKDIDLTKTDGATAFNTYATGRLNAKYLLTRFRLLGRQNFMTLSMEYVTSFFIEGFTPRDAIDVHIEPTNTVDNGFIFAIVNKANMRRARDDNYYLSLTKTIDSEKLPQSFTFMSEGAEINDFMLTKELRDALENADNVVDYLAVTDQLNTAPTSLEDLESTPRIVIALRFPSNEADEIASAKIVDAAVNLADVLASKKPWRPEVARKIKATREAEIKKVQKNLDAQKAEKLAVKKAEAKRDLKGSSRLSADEQRKLDQKEREKEQRKLRSRQVKRG